MAVDTSNGKLAEEASAYYIPERRKRERFRARWRVRLWDASDDIVEALTTNVSSGGFYCRSPRQFSEGDRLTALLEILGASAESDAHKLTLRCDIQVLRIEAVDGSSNWGLACQIRDYCVVGPRSCD
ncbi:MAG: PilZ domain-containing protein [Terriglobia bacterium]